MMKFPVKTTSRFLFTGKQAAYLLALYTIPSVLVYFIFLLWTRVPWMEFFRWEMTLVLEGGILLFIALHFFIIGFGFIVKTTRA